MDLSRVNKGYNDISLYGELNEILLLGREIDLLEIIRRQENPENDFFTISKQQLNIHGLALGIEPVTLERVSLVNLQENALINIDEDNIEINFQDSDAIFNYGISQIRREFSSKNKKLLDLLANGMVKPITEDYYQSVLSDFPSTLDNYLNKTKLLCPLQAKETIFYSSPKIYKNEDTFRKLLEDDDYNEIPKALEYLTDNPGIPLESIDPNIYDHNLLNGLTLSGALDPITLDIDGNSRRYLIPANLNNDRIDRDHLDQVKKTLANFRFGERYPRFRLRDSKVFLESLLENGFAGNASPIGTDYRQLELAGIISVERVSGDRYRLWMLKRDVIEDTIKILNGSVPIISENSTVNLNQMNDADISRMLLDNKRGDTKEIADALRKIQRGLL